ncbi:MAG: hypothetical protein ACTSW1_12100 [Candidatus Hodarchaeales archaeon]
MRFEGYTLGTFNYTLVTDESGNVAIDKIKITLVEEGAIKTLVKMSTPGFTIVVISSILIILMMFKRCRKKTVN